VFLKADNILEVDNLSKIYSRQDSISRARMAGTFARALLWRAPKTPGELKKGEFWSLKGISFSLKRGEAIGIIGFNGAGKTTLLKILSGQILPDGGEIRMSGDTASMIDLTAGFKTSATGYENIYNRGASLGYSKKEMLSREQEIIEFSELGDAIYAPYGTYSSGMKMRLAFSIMIGANPDILFIDEVMSVGDFRFRQKCLQKIREMRANSAFVLVSHSMNDISRFCNHVIVLNKGKIVFEGEPEEAIEYYLAQKENVKPSTQETKVKKIVGNFHTDETTIKNVKHYWCDADGHEIQDIDVGKDLYFRCEFELLKPVRYLTLGVPIWTEEGHYVTGYATKAKGSGNLPCKLGQNGYVLKIPNHTLNPGSYMSNIVVRDGPGYLYRQPNQGFSVNTTPAWHFGSVTMDNDWSVLEFEAGQG